MTDADGGVEMWYTMYEYYVRCRGCHSAPSYGLKLLGVPYCSSPSPGLDGVYPDEPELNPLGFPNATLVVGSQYSGCIRERYICYTESARPSSRTWARRRGATPSRRT